MPLRRSLVLPATVALKHTITRLLPAPDAFAGALLCLFYLPGGELYHFARLTPAGHACQSAAAAREY